MAAGKLEIKARIRSVESTKKITKAMQLVATSKLKKQKQYMEENRDYAYYLKETVQEICIIILSERNRAGNSVFHRAFQTSVSAEAGRKTVYHRLYK